MAQSEGEKLFASAMDAYYETKLPEALKLFQQAAAKGHAEAHTFFGRMHYAGEGTKQNYPLAITTYRKAISLGDSKANLLLGYAYLMGNGIAKDENQAQSLFKKAIPEVTKAADLGNPFWCWRLSTCYADGEGVDVDEEIELEYLKKASETNFGRAQFWLARKLYYERNYPDAMLWYRKASEHGFAAAKYEIGMMYYAGSGVKEDNELAFDWFSQAADAGEIQSLGSLGDMYDAGYYVERDWNEAFKYYQRYYQAGGGGAPLRKLGEFYVFGINGAEKNIEKAKELFKLSGDKRAAMYLEVLDKLGAGDMYRVANKLGDHVDITNHSTTPQILPVGTKAWSEKFMIGFKTAKTAQVWPTSIASPDFPKNPFDEIYFDSYTPSPRYSAEENVGSFGVYRNSPMRNIGYMYVVADFDARGTFYTKIPVAVCWAAE